MLNKLILVTGGTGFLGKEIVNVLVQNGYNVRVLTRNSNKYLNTNTIEYVDGDILNTDSLQKALKGCVGLIHSAGEKAEASKMHLINVEGTKNVCQAAIKSDIIYFCFVSSVGVIGLNKETIINENATCNPTNTYEQTKLIAEQYVLSNFKKENCSSVILRPTNVFGLKHLQFSNVFTSKLKRSLKGNEISNYVYVKDVAYACVYFLMQDIIYTNEVFIVNDCSENNTFKNIEHIAKGQSPALVAPIFIPWLFRYLKLGKNNLGNKVYSNEKLLQEGYTPLFGLEKGIKDALSNK